jgi:exosome complex component RRP40
MVIAIVHHSSADYFHTNILPNTPYALLPHLSFEGASKKSRPQLAGGAAVYARIVSADKHMDIELECVNSASGKSDGLGELKGGMLFDISLGLARRLLMAKPATQGKVIILEELAEKASFEVAIGRNGKIWIDSADVTTTLLVGHALKETDENVLSLPEQKALVRKLLRTFDSHKSSKMED